MAKMFGEQEQKEESNLPEPLRGKTPDEVFKILQEEHNRVVNDIKAKAFDDQEEANKNKPNFQQPKPGQQPPQGAQTPPGVRPGQTPPQPQGQAPTLPQGGQGDGRGQVSYWQDPAGFLDQQLNARLAPMVQAQVAGMRGTNKQLFQQRAAKDYEKYGEEMEAFIDNLAPQLQAHPEAYNQALNFVKSQHLNEIIEEERKSARSAGLAEALADEGVDPETIARIVAKSGGQQAQQPQPQTVTSLFQSPTGIPRVAQGSQSPAAQQQGNPGRRGGQYTPEERKMMEQFDMTPEEYEEMRSQNTDTYTALGDELGARR